MGAIKKTFIMTTFWLGLVSARANLEPVYVVVDAEGSIIFPCHYDSRAQGDNCLPVSAVSLSGKPLEEFKYVKEEDGKNLFLYVTAKGRAKRLLVGRFSLAHNARPTDPGDRHFLADFPPHINFGIIKDPNNKMKFVVNILEERTCADATAGS